MKIKKLVAREVLDSRGNPTIEAEVTTTTGHVGLAIVPSGASTGTREALELRDGDKSRYNGKGVLKAVSNVNKKIAPKVKGFNVTKQVTMDRFLIDLDGTENKSRLGANAILAVSLATAKAGAAFRGVPLYQHISNLYKVDMKSLPTPMMNIINGGSHADNGIDIQEFMIMPIGAKNINEAIRYGAEIFHTLKSLLSKDGYTTSVGDEGGFAPNLKNNEQALKYISKAIETAGYKLGKDIVIAMDVAASEMYDPKTKKYHFDGKKISSQKLLNEYRKMIKKYPIVSIEDPFSEFDWDTMIDMTTELGKHLQIVGDDNFVTNKSILKEGIERGCCNSILIKINQIGTLTETYQTIKLAKDNEYTTVISHRSGETEDASIADLAVGWDTGQIKTGSLSRTDRVAKYNQLIRINEQVKFRYAGSKRIKNLK